MPTVRAIQTGFYKGERKRVGDVFEVAKGEKARWFVPTDEASTGPKARGRSDGASSSDLKTGSGSSVGQGDDDLQ